VEQLSHCSPWIVPSVPGVPAIWRWSVPTSEIGELAVCIQLSGPVGCDASVKRDSSAIVVCAWDKKLQKVRLLAHRIFLPTSKDPIDFENAIENTLREYARNFNVRKVLFDPYQMAATAQRLQRCGLRIEEFPQTQPNLTAASQNLYELITGGNLILYPDVAMRLAASRAVAVETPRGWRISKTVASHKIDVIVALGMACYAAVQQQGSAGHYMPSPEQHAELMALIDANPRHGGFGGSQRTVPQSAFPVGQTPGPSDLQRIAYVRAQRPSLGNFMTPRNDVQAPVSPFVVRQRWK
jgi:hypothetical protein